MATDRTNKSQRSDLNVPNDAQARRDELTGTGEVPARFDPGSGETETDDGLDEYQEAARQGAEDIPVSERDREFEKLPVFDRAQSEPKV